MRTPFIHPSLGIRGYPKGPRVKGGSFQSDNPPPPDPLPALPAGYVWPEQVDPVTYDRSELMIWGDRWEGAQPEIFDKATWRSTHPRLAHSFSAVGDEIIFEVRKGDRYGYPTPEGGYTDPVGRERSEIQSTFLVPTSWNWAMGWEGTLEGPTNTAPWCVLMQSFSRNNGAGMGSPGFALTLEGDDTCHVIVRRGSSASPEEVYLANFQYNRGMPQEIWVEARASVIGDGFARVYLNGSTVIEAENINVGYTGQTHWEPTVGIYRQSPSGNETLRHKLKGMQVSW